MLLFGHADQSKTLALTLLGRDRATVDRWFVMCDDHMERASLKKEDLTTSGASTSM